MSMRYDRSGNRSRTFRTIQDETRVPLLVGDGWRDLAYTEILRLKLTATALHEQMEGEDCHEDLGMAAKSLKAALTALKNEYDQQGEIGSER